MTMLNTISCPFCDTVLAGQEDQFPAVDEQFRIHCPKCSRFVDLDRLFWVKRGIKISMRPELRCPYCFKLVLVGHYSDRPQRVKCRSCGKFSVYLRIDNPEADERAHTVTANAI
jgi:phage FluMu protein Com